ncbi:bifunctional UDP-N-acetylglucosamine diphosphorylase/glucosamine-1-phosphate N-acetyltransferase GlmU [Tianweitania sp. BSSL-BM11]|uniref:Bifunctional protein GlmU n=1 Tax=Tianweitania aestuarii TaxID=2814886 RepID=A0ABS5RU22_9HYPH|nr:bifunctional UDP-N-acetylglucosamine diphosphorylase/glucosamine-1-phosphate N-acetyltransferase GlmU [Tianweitania aestuarii]MBS9720442.1 bifunctional UDP-N-acetylglucosamine diphosphorylase/glucosamine-1-phosphate N-acetyltransferase GlmU [Tianweitania aestuarii]
MTDRSCLSIVLAAGEGTRMKSALPKVLHKVAGLPLVGHVVAAARGAGAGAGDIAVVVGRGAEEVRAAIDSKNGLLETFVQTERKGTGHAVLAARDAISRGYDDLLVLFGDTPLVQSDALLTGRDKLAGGAAVVVMGFRTDKPAGYGRLIEDNGALVAIREDKDCSEAERAITFCNGGLMAIAGEHALALLDAIGNDNAKGEYYLTDIVALARDRGLTVVAAEVNAQSVLGVNNRVELAEAEALWQTRRRHAAMIDGATLIAPETVFFSHDTVVGPDTIIEPNVFFGPGVTVDGGVTIHAFSHLEGAVIGKGAQIGPFARLRPGTELGDKSKVGNFCEVKKSKVGAGAKINHLSYIGDASIGAGSNIGAGTITCNYDGLNKFKTQIGERAFVGSNSSLVAPVSIGDGAYVASGSVITQDVPGDALAFGRARQKTMDGRAEDLRARQRSIKDASSK